MDMPDTDQNDKKPKLNRSGVIGSGGIELSSKKPAKNQPRQNSKIKKLALILIIIGIFIIAVILSYFLYFDDVIRRGGVFNCDADSLSINDRIKCTSDPKEKAKLYQEKINSKSLITKENSVEALADAYEAERLAPTWATALTIANIESVYGDVNKAIKYYNLVLDRYPSHPDAQYFRDIVNYLRKG